MKKLAILLLLFRSCNPSFAQRNIYSPVYPLSVAYVNKTGLDSNFNFFMSQGFLDSLKFSYDSIKNHRTAINTLTGQIATTNSILNNNKKTTDSIVANWPTGGGGVVIIPSRTMSVPDSIKQSDLARDIYTNFSGTVTVPLMPDGWYCWVWRKSGTPTFKTPSGTILGTISVKGGLVKIASNGTTMNVSVR